LVGTDPLAEHVDVVEKDLLSDEQLDRGTSLAPWSDGRECCGGLGVARIDDDGVRRMTPQHRVGNLCGDVGPSADLTARVRDDESLVLDEHPDRREHRVMIADCSSSNWKPVSVAIDGKPSARLGGKVARHGCNEEGDPGKEGAHRDHRPQ
jgi:hypothetical protein